MKILIGGHRGVGVTDSDYAKAKPNLQNLEQENTLSSFAKAFELGADFVETDILFTKDGVPVCLHSNPLSRHYPEIQEGCVNEIEFAQLQKLPVGKNVQGKLCTLEELLFWLASRPELLQGEFALNLEIKGVKQNLTKKNFQTLAALIKSSGVPVEKILFSSFDLFALIQAMLQLPEAQFGLLFTETPYSQKLYEAQEPYFGIELPFEVDVVHRVLEIIKTHTGKTPQEIYLHPEIKTTSFELLDKFSFTKGYNFWVYEELWNKELEENYKTLLFWVTNSKPKIVGFITDYIVELKKLIKNMIQ